MKTSLGKTKQIAGDGMQSIMRCLVDMELVLEYGDLKTEKDKRLNANKADAILDQRFRTIAATAQRAAEEIKKGYR
jgi:hypothetical protein